MPIPGPTTPLTVDLAGVPLRNPVMLAAGCAGTLHEFADVLDLGRVGAVVSKSITREPRAGNPTRRIAPAPGGAGMLNAIGLSNPGLEAFEENYLPIAQGMETVVFCSVAGFSIDDYCATAAAIAEWRDRGVRGIELNVSCPNVHTGLEFGGSAGAMRDLLGAVRPLVSGVALLVKLSPVAPDLPHIARTAIESGADGLTICNTIPAMAIDPETRRPVLSNITGGLSGPGLHPVAVRLVHEVYRGVAKDAHGKGKGVPIIGSGGVLRWEHAAEFILAGATAVQMGTALYADPRSPVAVVRGLERWVARQGRESIGELVGAIELSA